MGVYQHTKAAAGPTASLVLPMAWKALPRSSCGYWSTDSPRSPGNVSAYLHCGEVPLWASDTNVVLSCGKSHDSNSRILHHQKSFRNPHHCFVGSATVIQQKPEHNTCLAYFSTWLCWATWNRREDNLQSAEGSAEVSSLLSCGLASAWRDYSFVQGLIKGRLIYRRGHEGGQYSLHSPCLHVRTDAISTHLQILLF